MRPTPPRARRRRLTPILVVEPDPVIAERLEQYIDRSGGDDACHLWTGGYNTSGRGGRGKGATAGGARRPIFNLPNPTYPRGSQTVYVVRYLLAVTSDGDLRPLDEEGKLLEAGHTCQVLPPEDGFYRCVNLRHLRWVTRWQNEQDKKVAREATGDDA